MTALDEAELVRQMERAAAENEEVAGDDDADEEEMVYSEGENGHKNDASEDEEDE